MSIVVDKCCINDYKNNILTLLVGDDHIVKYKLDRSIPILNELCNNSNQYKVYLSNSVNDEMTLMKIEEIEIPIDDTDIPEPDYMETLDMKNELLRKVNMLIQQYEEKLKYLRNIHKDGSKNISVENIQNIYNKLNDWI